MTEPIAAPDGGQAAPVAPAAAPAEPQATPTTWTDSLAPELKDYVTAKGFKDAGSVLESYRNLEKLRGVPADRLLTLPGNADEAGAMDGVWDKLGRPEAADKYTNALGDGIDAGVYEKVSAEAHKLGLSDAQFQGLQKALGAQGQAVMAAQEAQASAAFDKWKGANAEGFETAARVMNAVGMNEESLASLLAGDKAAMYDFVAKVGARSAEGKIVHGESPQSGAFGMSPAAAKEKISALYADTKFMDSFTSANATVRKPAMEKMEALQKAAVGG